MVMGPRLLAMLSVAAFAGCAPHYASVPTTSATVPVRGEQAKPTMAHDARSAHSDRGYFAPGDGYEIPPGEPQP
jgi:hypothetical protein